MKEQIWLPTQKYLWMSVKTSQAFVKKKYVAEKEYLNNHKRPIMGSKDCTEQY